MAAELGSRIGRKIRARRLELNLTQGQVADRIPSPAVTNQYISDWERGKRPSDKHLEMLVDALEVDDAAYFYDGEEPTNLELRLTQIEQRLEAQGVRIAATSRLLQRLADRAPLEEPDYALLRLLAGEVRKELEAPRSQSGADDPPVGRERPA